MDRIEKALEKLSSRERAWAKDILERLAKNDFKGLRIQKLKGRNDIFRVRKGDIRILYRTDEKGKIFILRIDRRNEKTYRNV